MCGRYTTAQLAYDWIEEQLEMGWDPMEECPDGDIFPGDNIQIVAAGEDGPKLMKANWGLLGKEKGLIINARCETVLSRPSFAASFEARRCLVPACGFYEWDKDKNKVLFKNQGDEPIYLAGFWTYANDEYCFVILTTDANESMASVHDRMPVMIKVSDARAWLNDFERAKEMLLSTMPALNSFRDSEQISFF